MNIKTPIAQLSTKEIHIGNFTSYNSHLVRNLVIISIVVLAAYLIYTYKIKPSNEKK
jgi:hypothetical protein